MTFLKTNINRILTNKIRLLVILVIPILFIATFASLEYEKPVKVAVIDEDNTAFSQELTQHIEGNFLMVSVEKDDMITSLIDGKIHYGILIPGGFTRQVIAGESPKAEGYSISGVNTAAPVEGTLNTFLMVADNIARAANYDEAAFYRGMETFSGGQPTVSFEVSSDTNRSKSTMAMGFLVQFMLYMSVLTTGIIAEDKKNRTLYRIFSAPVSMIRYMGENLLSFIVIAALQVLSIMAILKFGLNIYFGISIWNMIVLFLTFAVVSIAFGLIITTYARNPVQAYITIFLVTTPLVMLGGSYWPRDYMPDILIKIGNFLPTSWVMSGVGKLLHGGNLSSITQELVVLTAFAGVFFLIGILRRADLAK